MNSYVLMAFLSALAAICAYQLMNSNSNVQSAATPPTPVQAYDIIALADLHGDLAKAKEALMRLGVTDSAGKWSARNATLIQLGDMVDRGPYSVDVVDLFEELALQARQLGGSVVRILGNHDLMLVQSDYRYVNRGEMKRLGGSKAWEELLGHEGRIGKILRSRLIAHITDTPGCSFLFIHAGVLEWMLDLVDHKSLNGSQIVSQWNDLAFDALARCRGRHDCQLSRQQEALLGGHGLVWTRAFTPGSDLTDPSGARVKSTNAYICDQARRVTTRLGVQAIVVGHTVQDSISNNICEGLLYMIDVGMSRWVANGPPAALRCSQSLGIEIIY
jgi:hypothetical protein